MASEATTALDLPAIRIAHLYPSLLNVAGDTGNLLALERRAAWRGIATATQAIEVGDHLDPTACDVILFHGGQDVEMAVVAADLATKAGALREAADRGVVILGVCAGLQLLGHRYIPAHGPVMTGASVLDLETRAGPERFMQHAACTVTIGGETRTVVGFENHSGVTELGDGVEPFGLVIAGAGNNGRDGTEGARRDHVYATYLHGPILPKNPWLADTLLRQALERAVGGPVELAPLPGTTEEAAHEVALAKAIRNRGRRTALVPASLGRRRAGRSLPQAVRRPDRDGDRLPLRRP